MNFKTTSAAVIAAVLMSQICFAWESPSPWSASKEYKGRWQDGEGDTVTHGTFNNKPLMWWAKFAADGSLAPGEFAAEGGTSPWVLINSLSGGKFTATAWESVNGSAALNNLGSMQAKVPTWRDGANGAYTIILDDIGGMPFEESVKPGWDAVKNFPDIKLAWGVIVGKMDDDEWKNAIQMVAQGHEMVNHTIDHTSSADQWQIYYPGKMVSQTDPAVPPMVRGLEVVGTWNITAATSASGKSPTTITFPMKFGPDGWSGTITQQMTQGTADNSSFGNPATHIPNGSIWIDNDGVNGGHPFTITAESEMVTIKMPAYWTGYDPLTGIPFNDPRIEVTPKSTYKGIPVETVTLAGGQKVYVAYTNKNPAATEFEGYQEGYIAATGVQWFDEGLIISDYPHYYNGARIQKDWSTGSEVPTNGKAGWYVTTRDEGRPGFVAKLFCINGWDGGAGVAGPQTKRNVDTANYIINKNIYENITSAGEYFAKGKRSEYMVYPYDAYSEKTHDHLYRGVDKNYTSGFVGARGGAKSGKAIPGDFFHPFRIDFDAFYINQKSWTAATSNQDLYKVPNNPHVLLGINELVDSVVKTNGYMIRELHAVADLGSDWCDDGPSDLWKVNNSGLGQGGWWGGITKNQFTDHLGYVQTLIDQKKLTVFTPSEAVKYRMTANAFETNATLTQDGQNWKVKLTQKPNETVDDIHKEEISVIVNLGTPVTKLAVAYDANPTNTSADNSPRRQPRKMDANGQIWSVSINPFKTNDHSALLIRDGEWFGQNTDYNENPTNFEKPTGVRNVATKTVRMTFAGIRNGQIALNLSAGNYVAELYNVQGRLIGSANVNALDGVNVTTLKTTNLGKGIMILNVKDAKGAAVIQHKLMLK